MMGYTTLIQPKELSALLEGGGPVVVCDCSFDLANPGAGRVAYSAGHIPGAFYLGLDDVLSGAKTGLNGRHPLPDRGKFASDMAALGVSAGTQVVAYDAADGMFAARLWVLMRWLGHGAVAVLDGGLAGWHAAGFTVDTVDPVPRSRGTLESAPSLVPVVDYAAVLAASQAGNRVILDARAPDRFRGENETLDPVGGHIPGARIRFFRNTLAGDNRFKPAASLRQEFETALDGQPAASAVAQCGSGVTACHNLLAMEIAGLPGAALYPGSWSEWSAQAGAPIAQGAE